MSYRASILIPVFFCVVFTANSLSAQEKKAEPAADKTTEKKAEEKKSGDQIIMELIVSLPGAQRPAKGLELLEKNRGILKRVISIVEDAGNADLKGKYSEKVNQARQNFQKGKFEYDKKNYAEALPLLLSSYFSIRDVLKDLALDYQKKIQDLLMECSGRLSEIDFMLDDVNGKVFDFKRVLPRNTKYLELAFIHLYEGNGFSQKKQFEQAIDNYLAAMEYGKRIVHTSWEEAAQKDLEKKYNISFSGRD